MKEFRPYQQSLIDKTIASEKDDIICLPTGGGKTVIASGIINRLDRKVIFVVPRLELIRQAKDEFGDVDIIWSDKTSLEGRHCILASFRLLSASPPAPPGTQFFPLPCHQGHIPP